MATFDDLKAEYRRLWDTMQVRPERVDAVQRIVAKLIGHKATYQAAERKTGVPWAVIAAWHNRESDASFTTQLAQGDPLSRVSTHVPTGRGPFSSWEDGAFDALVTLKHLDKITEWSPERICYETERYNGFGYRNNHPSVLSPYLWSFSKHYTRGKYVADGKFSNDAVDQQCGAIPIIRLLMGVELQKPPVTPVPSTPPKETPMQISSLFTLLPLINRFFQLLPMIQDATRSGQSIVSVVMKFAPDLLGLLSGIGGSQFPELPPPSQLQIGGLMMDPVKVRGIQNKINMLGLATPALSEDGLYGAKTKAAVTAFQTAHNITPADGWAGDITSAALQTEVNKLKPVNQPF